MGFGLGVQREVLEVVQRVRREIRGLGIVKFGGVLRL